MKISSIRSSSSLIFEKSISNSDEESMDDVCGSNSLPNDLQTSLINPPGVVHEIPPNHSSMLHTIAAIIKAFAGSGILFQPRAVYNGGMALYISAMFLVFVSAMYCTHLLVRCAEKSNTQTYSDIARFAYGRFGQALVDISIVMSQIGFCAVYCVFVSTNTRDIFLYFKNCDAVFSLGVAVLLVFQAIIYIPLVWVRKLSYYGPFLLAADAAIIIGIVGMLVYILRDVFVSGSGEFSLINSQQWPVMLGTVIYSWEGISLILPIRSTVPEHLRKGFMKTLVISLTFFLIGVITFSSLSYYTYGINVHSIILFNLPANRITIFIQFLYIISIIITYPFMLFPALHSIENRLFKYATGHSLKRKWKKNTLRAFLVLVTIALAYIALQELDNFVALIGSFCCIPLMYIYPCLFHIKISHTNNLLTRFLRQFMVIMGVVFLIFTTYSAISLWHTHTLLSRCGI